LKSSHRATRIDGSAAATILSMPDASIRPLLQHPPGSGSPEIARGAPRPGLSDTRIRCRCLARLSVLSITSNFASGTPSRTSLSQAVHRSGMCRAATLLPIETAGGELPTPQSSPLVRRSAPPVDAGR
jgi:hypothetical protein